MTDTSVRTRAVEPEVAKEGGAERTSGRRRGIEAQLPPASSRGRRGTGRAQREGRGQPGRRAPEVVLPGQAR